MIDSLIANLCLLAVGSVFLLTGIAKVLEPWMFAQHVARLRLLKPQWVKPVSLVFIAFETSLGIALMLNVFPSVVISVTLMLLIGLSVLTYWSTSTGRTEDCGCYNGWLEISPIQSLLLNAFYSALLIVAWMCGGQETTVLWQWILPIITLIVSGALASGHLEYRLVNGRPYVELTRLQVNRRWQSRWLKGAIAVTQGSSLVVFLGIQCPQCKKWLNILKVIHSRTDLPDVIGVVAAPAEVAQGYAAHYALNFPLVTIQSALFSNLVVQVPTAVILEDGVIQEKWVRVMPQAFIEQIASGDMTVPEGQPHVLMIK